MSNRFEILEEQSRVLQQVASSFPHESPQYLAIQNAAYAFLFAMSEHYESFVHYIDACGSELSDQQKEGLRKLGISED